MGWNKYCQCTTVENLQLLEKGEKKKTRQLCPVCKREITFHGKHNLHHTKSENNTIRHRKRHSTVPSKNEPTNKSSSTTMMKSPYTAMMEDDHPRLLQRSYSTRTLDQHDQGLYHDSYLQFLPDGSTRTILLSSASFDEGILTANASPRDGSFEPSQRRELPPRIPRKQRSLYYSTAPRHPDLRTFGPLSGRPMLERRKSEFVKRGDASFPREDYHHAQQRPSLTTIDSRGYTSSRSVMKEPPKPSQSNRSRKKDREHKTFQPQRSNSIYRKFDKKVANQVDDDVWVERLILNDGVKKTCFKSLHGNITRSEPPTGAKTIVYLEDIIVDHKGRPSMTRAKSSKKEKKKSRSKSETAPPSPTSPTQTSEDSVVSELSKETESSKSPSTASKREKKKKHPKGELKRRSSLFVGFMKKKKKKDKKNKTVDAENE